MPASLRQRGTRRVVILGAGFNAPLGMPLTADLLRQVHAVAASKPWRLPDGRPAPFGMADWLLQVLDWYYPLAGISHAAVDAGAARVNLEEFLSLVAATSMMEWRSQPGANEHGDPFNACLRSWLGEAIERQQRLRCYEAMITPWLVVPSYDKIFQVLSLGQVWQLPWDWLDERLDVQVIGYSIRPDDYHSRALVYPRLVRGARRRRLRVAVVDRAPDAWTREEIIGRFAGVQGCRLWFDGFSPQALEFLEDR